MYAPTHFLAIVYLLSCLLPLSNVLLQSDARDAGSLQEHSPYLLRDRLLMPNLTAVTYVNGG